MAIDLETKNDILEIMKHDITALLIQHFSAVPKREISVFCDPLKYHTFIKTFQNVVEENTNNCACKQYTKGHAQEFVRSCHINPDQGYLKAKTFLKEWFDNEQEVSSAYLDKALLWPPIKTEDVKASSSEDVVMPWRICSTFMIQACLPTCWASLETPVQTEGQMEDPGLQDRYMTIQPEG